MANVWADSAPAAAVARPAGSTGGNAWSSPATAVLPGASAAPGLETALGTRLGSAERQRLAEAIASGRRLGQAPGGGFLGALSRDLSGVITSIPASAALVGRTAFTVGNLPAQAGANVLSRLTPIDSPARFFNRQSKGTVDDLVLAGRAIVADYQHRYTPALRGDWGTFGRQFMEHPLSYLLDAGSVYSALGKGASLGARTAGFGPAGARTVAAGEGSNLERFLSYLGDTSAAGRRRARDDRRVYAPQSASTEDLLPVLQARPAGSLNPVTNAVQRYFDRRVDARDRAFAGAEGRLPQQVGHFTVPGSATWRYNAANRRIGETVRMQATDSARREFTTLSRDYQRITRKLGPVSKRLRGRDGYEEALTLHTAGLLNWRELGYGSPQDALQGAIDYWRIGIQEARREGEHVGRSEEHLAALEKLGQHPELLDLESAPPILQAAVREGRKLIRTGQAKITSSEDFVKPGTGLITKKMVDDSRVRWQEQVHGGSTYSPDLVNVDKPVITSLSPDTPYTVRELTDAKRALQRRLIELKKPAARKEALAEVRAVERQINEGIREFQRGNREKAIVMIRDGQERLRALEEGRQANLPGGLSALGPAAIPELRQIAGQDRILARASELEAQAAEIESRYQALLDHLGARSGDRGARNEFLSAEQEQARALEDFASQKGAEGMNFADVIRSDNLYPLITDHVRPSEVERWRPGRTPRSKAAKALAAKYDHLAEIRSKLKDRAKVGKHGEIEGYDLTSIEPALREAADAVKQQLVKEADARNAARGTDLPSRLEALKRKVAGARSDTRAIAHEIARLNGQRPLQIYPLVQQARQELEALATGTEKQRAAAERWLNVTEDAFKQSIAERVALLPEGPAREQALRVIADPNSSPLALPDGPLPIRHPREVLDAIEEVGNLRAEAQVMRDALAHHEGKSALELSDPEVARSLSDVYDALARELGGSETKMVSSRRRRAANSSGETGPAAGLVTKEQRARGGRQAKRMFGEGSRVPRSRETFGTDVPGLVGRRMSERVDRPPTPIEAALESIAAGQKQGLLALEHLIPEELAKEHRAALAQVYEELGAVRASFGGTPADLEQTMRDLAAVKKALAQAKKASTGGWTTPRHIDAMHAQIPQTGEMMEARQLIEKGHQQRADILDELRAIQKDHGNTPEEIEQVRALQGALSRVETRLRKAEVAYHELETQEGIKLYGEFTAGEGDYLPARPRKGQKPKAERDDRGGRPRPQNRFTAERIYGNTGKLLRRFNVETGRRDPLYVLMRGIRAEHSALGLRSLIDHAGVKWARDGFNDAGVLTHEAGDLVTGNKAVVMMRQSPDLFRTVHLPSMHNVLERMREETPDGEWGDQTIMERLFMGADEVETVEQALKTGEWAADDVVLLPKAAADEYVDASHGIFRGYDNALGVWKAGVLAFTPRWYVLNLVGNTMQYGLLSGGDARSILLAGLGRHIAPTKKLRAKYARIGDEIAHQVPEELASVSQASEASQALSAGSAFSRVTDRAFEFNQSLEGLIRRAAYINSAKRQLKYAGKRGEIRSADGLVQALDEMPVELKAEALREALLFLGDYRRFNRFERGFVRRVMPFYSWVRVISRLTLGLPFKSPLRAEALQLLATATQAQWDPLEEALELGRPNFARGAIEIPEGVPVVGGLTLRTNALNPFQTVNELYAPVLAAAGEGGPSAALGQAVQSIAPSLAPGTTAIIEAALPGRNVFGDRAVTAPAGYGGLIQSFGGSFMAPTANGYRQTGGPGVPFVENLLQSFLPYYGSTARSVLSGSQTAYDTATLPSMVLSRLGIEARVPGLFDSRKGQVFRPPAKGAPANTNLPLLTPLSSFLGFPLSRRDELAEAQRVLDDLERQREAAKQTSKRSARELARLGGSP